MGRWVRGLVGLSLRRLVGLLVGRSIGWSVGWSVSSAVRGFVGPSVGLSAHPSVCWSVGQLVDGLVQCWPMVNGLVHPLVLNLALKHNLQIVMQSLKNHLKGDYFLLRINIHTLFQLFVFTLQSLILVRFSVFRGLRLSFGFLFLPYGFYYDQFCSKQWMIRYGIQSFGDVMTIKEKKNKHWEPVTIFFVGCFRDNSKIPSSV